MLNRKLTPIIAGRTVKRVAQSEGALHVEFDDGSILKIKTGAPFTDSIAGRKVKKALQKGTEFDLEFDDKSKAKIVLSEETSSVMLRNKAGELEYAD